ncbi:MAG: N-acetylmuramoyl-L-alanine amidase family protein, partial [Stomatobaculum longum]
MRRKTKQGLWAVLLAAAVACLVPTVTAYAIEGWNREGNEWQYLNREDQPVTNAFKKSKDDWFYLDERGFLLKNRIFSFGGDDFYVDQDGRMVRNAWIFIDSEKDPDGNYGDSAWHYFGADGKGLRAKGKGFRKEIDGQAYAFDENGRMLTGWISDEGAVLEDENPFVNARYYADADGALYTNRWLYYDWGSHLTSEVSGRSYEDYEKMWFYFGADSKKYRSREGEAPFRRDIDGQTYGFDENGVMVDWWNKVATVSDAVRSNPTSDVRVRYYNGYDGGPTLKNRWLWMYPSENLDANENRDLECSWWRTDSKGRVYRNKILQVGEREYAFDGIGRMKTGFVLFDGRHEFVAQYDVDAWDAAHFINGDIYGIEKADLYLFSPDELNDGSMQVGKEITIELADGPRTFAFAPSGKAYGNRNCLQKKDNKFYINGLRLDAPEEQGYGVVSQNIGTLD